MDNKNNPFILCPDCISDRMKLKGILADFFPTEKLKINIVLAAFDEGIANEIRSASEIDNLLAGRFVKLLTLDYGISEDYARWATNYWFDNYGVAVLGKVNRIQIEVKPQTQTKQPPKTQAPKQTIAPPAGIISVKKLQEKEKLPKALIQRFESEEQKQGITDLRCSIVKDYTYDRYCNLKITGEYSGKASRYTLIMVMIYNANDELIEARFGEKIDQDFKGKRTFSMIAQVPNDEYISRVVVRLTPDPVFS